MDIQSVQVLGHVENSALIQAVFSGETVSAVRAMAYRQAADSMGIALQPGDDARAVVLAKSHADNTEEIIENLTLAGLSLAAADASGVRFYDVPSVVNSASSGEGDGLTMMLSVREVPEIDLASYEPVLAAIPKVPREQFSDEEQYRFAVKQLYDAAVAETLSKRLEKPVDEAYVRWNAEDLKGRILQSLQAQGMTLDDYIAQAGLRNDGMLNEAIGKQARSAASEGVALDAIFRQAGLELTDEDRIAAAAAIVGADVEDPIAVAREMGMLHAVEESAARMVALRFAADQAEITEMTQEELDELRPQPKKGFAQDGMPKAGPLVMHNKDFAGTVKVIAAEE